MVITLTSVILRDVVCLAGGGVEGYNPQSSGVGQRGVREVVVRALEGGEDVTTAVGIAVDGHGVRVVGCHKDEGVIFTRHVHRHLKQKSDHTEELL